MMDTLDRLYALLAKESMQRELSEGAAMPEAATFHRSLAAYYGRLAEQLRDDIADQNRR